MSRCPDMCLLAIDVTVPYQSKKIDFCLGIYVSGIIVLFKKIMLHNMRDMEWFFSILVPNQNNTSLEILKLSLLLYYFQQPM